MNNIHAIFTDLDGTLLMIIKKLESILKMY